MIKKFRKLLEDHKINIPEDIPEEKLYSAFVVHLRENIDPWLEEEFSCFILSEDETVDWNRIREDIKDVSVINCFCNVLVNISRK